MLIFYYKNCSDQPCCGACLFFNEVGAGAAIWRQFEFEFEKYLKLRKPKSIRWTKLPVLRACFEAYSKFNKYSTSSFDVWERDPEPEPGAGADQKLTGSAKLLSSMLVVCHKAKAKWNPAIFCLPASERSRISFKGTVQRDFRPQVFFIIQASLGHWPTG